MIESTKRKKICLFDVNGGNWLGGSQYIRNIISALESLDSEIQEQFSLVCLTDGSIPVSKFCKTIVVKRDERTLFKRAVGRLRLLTGIVNPLTYEALKAIRPDFAFPTAPGTRQRVGYRSANWMADFQTFIRPEFSPADYRESMQAYTRSVMKCSETIVLSSEASKRDCEKLFPSDIPKTFVMPFRAASLFSNVKSDPENLAPKYNIPSRYFIICNQFWANKNHLTVFEAIRLLLDQRVNVHVVCTGRLNDLRDPGFGDLILQSMSKLGIKSSVTLLGALPRGEMVDLMRGALAVIQPSQFEGWNTSVEEAHCLGIPLVVSDIQVHREQDHPSARYFNPTSPSELAQLLKRFWEDDSRTWDKEREAAALMRYKGLVRSFGLRFLELALER